VALGERASKQATKYKQLSISKLSKLQLSQHTYTCINPRQQKVNKRDEQETWDQQEMAKYHTKAGQIASKGFLYNVFFLERRGGGWLLSLLWWTEFENNNIIIISFLFFSFLISSSFIKGGKKIKN
jgi:transposase